MSSLTINRPEHVQDTLFEVCPDAVFASAEVARVHYGNAMEELVCGSLGLTPIPLSGKFDVNFDAMKGDDDFEIKSVRKKDGKVPLYDWRCEKEAAANPDLIYVFGLHSAGEAKSIREIWEQYQSRGVVLVLAPSPVVHSLVKREPLRRIFKEKKRNEKGANGWNRKGYCRGYRNFNVNYLFDMLAEVGELTFSKYGFDIKIKTVKVI